MERAQVLRDDYGPRTHEMQRMSRTLDLLQKTELFGAVFWFARQAAAPVDQTCVSGAPDLTFCVDPRNPEQDVCVYVSLQGFHLKQAEGCSANLSRPVPRMACCS